MAFGMHNILSNRLNRSMQYDYKLRASHRKEALRSYIAKAKRTGEGIKDFMPITDREEIRAKLRSARIRSHSLNLVVLVLVLILIYSMISYMS